MGKLAKGHMCLVLSERKAVLAEAAARYRRVTKKQRKVMLDEIVNLTGLSRGYVSWALRVHGTNQHHYSRGKTYVLKTDIRNKGRGHRPGFYLAKDLLPSLVKIWDLSRYLCGKRLSVFIRENISGLKGMRELALSRETSEKLLAASPATLDRLMSDPKKKFRLRGLSHTRPAKLFLRNVPIQTSFDKPTEVGHLQVDLVGHDGGNARGEFCYTLTVTDIATGWTTVKAILNKAQKWVLEALKEVLSECPFPVLGIHSDSGSEFINKPMLAFCEENKIAFTRSRPGRKNDNCHVEQKNDTVVRNSVGYFRFEGFEALEKLNVLYQWVNLNVNFFEPQMKLKEKIRIGSKVTKKYYPPVTPFQKVLSCVSLPNEVKEKLKIRRASVDLREVYEKRKEALQSILNITKKVRG